MTTAHRPQLDPASGKKTLAGHIASHHTRAGQLPQFTYLKEKLAKKLEREELKRQLFQAENKHFGKTGKSTGTAEDEEEPKAIAASGDDAEAGSPTGTKRKLDMVDYESSDDEETSKVNGARLGFSLIQSFAESIPYLVISSQC